jgi:hypothetical protein
MLYDPDNPVVKLCVKGIETEYGGDLDRAAELYEQAWELSGCDLEWFTAAHYIARVKRDPAETLRWNLLALEHAVLVDKKEVQVTYPSLYLNVGQSYEQLGNIGQAKEYYLLAFDAAKALPTDEYGKMIRKGIGAALQRHAG